MEAYYNGWFKVHKVEVVVKERYCDTFACYPSFYFKYLVRFPNGKLKYVKDNKMIFE